MWGSHKLLRLIVPREEDAVRIGQEKHWRHHDRRRTVDIGVGSTVGIDKVPAEDIVGEEGRGCGIGRTGARLEVFAPGQVYHRTAAGGELKLACAVAGTAAVAYALHSAIIGGGGVEASTKKEIAIRHRPDGVDACRRYHHPQVGQSSVAVLQPDARRVLVVGSYAWWVGTGGAVGRKHIPASPFRPRCHGIGQRTGHIQARHCVGSKINEHDIFVCSIAPRCRHAVLRSAVITRAVAFAIYNTQGSRLKQLHLVTVIPRIEVAGVLLHSCLHYQHTAAAVAQQRHAGIAAVVVTAAPPIRLNLGAVGNVRPQWLVIRAGRYNARTKFDGAVGIGRELGVGSSPQRKGESDVAHIRHPRRRVVAVDEGRVHPSDVHPQ